MMTEHMLNEVKDEPKIAGGDFVRVSGSYPR